MMFDAARALIIHTTMHELYELHRCWLSINFRRLRHNPARGRDIMNSSNEARDGTPDTQSDWLSSSTDTVITPVLRDKIATERRRSLDKNHTTILQIKSTDTGRIQ